MQTLGDVVTAVLIAAALIVVPYKLAKAWIWPHIKPTLTWLFSGPTVKHPDDSDTNVMSRAPIRSAPFLAPSLQTDDGKTSDRRMMPVPTPSEMLDIFKVLRARGITRDELRGPWRAAGLPLDNNQWTKAAPTDDAHVTPIAGRPTSAKFETDPDFPYQAPA